MENDSISSSSESKLPLYVGLAGFALGAAGLVLAIKAKGEAKAASEGVAGLNATVAEVSGQLSSKANAVDLATISKDFGDYRASVDQSIKAIEDKVNASISAKGKGSANVAAGPGEYVVQKGDTLGGIAKKVVSINTVKFISCYTKIGCVVACDSWSIRTAET